MNIIQKINYYLQILFAIALIACLFTIIEGPFSVIVSIMFCLLPIGAFQLLYSIHNATLAMPSKELILHLKLSIAALLIHGISYLNIEALFNGIVAWGSPLDDNAGLFFTSLALSLGLCIFFMRIIFRNYQPTRFREHSYLDLD